MDIDQPVGSGVHHGDSVYKYLAVVCLFPKVRTFKVCHSRFEIHKQCCYL